MEEIEKAITEYFLEETMPISPIRESGDNAVFSVGEINRKILRISKRLPIEDVEFEYEAMQYLSKRGIPLPKWNKTKNGKFFVLIDGKVSVLFDFLEGRHVEVAPNHLPTKAQALSAGRGLGLISNVAIGFVSVAPRKRNIFSELERALSFSNTFIDDFEGGTEFITQVEKVLEFGRSQHEIEGFIHNDYRPGNVFFNSNEEVSGIIDFDWSCIGPVIKDLALAAMEWSFPDGATKPDFEVFDAFLQGYNSITDHPQKKDKKLYSWIAFSALSEAATYFCDLAEDRDSTKRTIKSYMYRKYLFFSAL